MATRPADMDVHLLKGLWALHLTANRRKHIQPLSPIHITNAALPQTLANPTGRSVVKLRSVGDASSIPDGFILVSLVGGRAEQAPLDFHLEGKQSYTIEVIGDNDIFLAGNVISSTTSPSECSQLAQRTTNGDPTKETAPQIRSVQQAPERPSTAYNSSTSSIASASSETSNSTVAPIKANVTGLDKIDFSRLTFNDVKKGTGEVVDMENRVSVYFQVVNVQKKTYIAQWTPGEGRDPFEFDVGSRSVMEGFNQGIIGMREGGVREIYIPCKLAYGTKGLKDIPPDTDVIIRCELIKVDSDI